MKSGTDVDSQVLSAVTLIEQGDADSRSRAETWWRRAAEAGRADAQYNLGLLGEKYVGQYASYLRDVALADHRNAQYARLLYQRGDAGSLSDAEGWWTAAADAGQSHAQHDLGMIVFLRADSHSMTTAEMRLLYVRCDTTSVIEAEGFWRPAANSGHTHAQQNCHALSLQQLRVDEEY